MAYVDKKGQKYEYQFCIVFKEGGNNELRHYFWTSEESIRNVMKRVKGQKPASDGNNVVYSGVDYEVRFNSERIGSLEIKVENFESGRRAFLELSKSLLE